MAAYTSPMLSFTSSPLLRTRSRECRCSSISTPPNASTRIVVGAESFIATTRYSTVKQPRLMIDSSKAIACATRRNSSVSR